MTWVRIEDDAAGHPKFAIAGPRAFELWVAGLCYCNRYLTDGLIPKSALGSLLVTMDERTAKRVAAGLARNSVKPDGAPSWVDAGDHYLVHDFAAFQPPRSKVLADRQAARDRMNASYRRKKGASFEDSSAEELANAGRSSAEEITFFAYSSPSPTRTHTERVLESAPSSRACEAEPGGESWIEEAYDRVAQVYSPHALQPVDGKRAVCEACARSLKPRSELTFGRDLPAIRRNGTDSDDPLSMTVDDFVASAVAWSLSGQFRRGKAHTLRNFIERGICLTPAPPPDRDDRETAHAIAMQAPGYRAPAPEFDLKARLEGLAASLPLSNGLGDRIRALAGDAEQVESELSKLDADLLDTLIAALGDELRAEVESSVGRTIAGLGSRLPAEEREKTRESVFRQAVRSKLGVPVLSLFSPEAEGAS